MGIDGRKERAALLRWPGRGAAPPLLVYGHADVVGVEGQAWTHPPFEGVLDGGYVWGRGAIDMKGPDHDGLLPRAERQHGQGHVQARARRDGGHGQPVI